MWEETLAISEDYLMFCIASRGSAPPPPGEPAAAMRRLAGDAERQCPSCLRVLALAFLAKREVDACAFLRQMMVEMVADGKLSWGRVVALFTFTGVLARQLQLKEGVQLGGQDRGGSCGGLAQTLADYIGKEKRDWLLENGGWEGFSKFSSVAREGEESAVKAVVLLAALLSVSAAGLVMLLLR